MSHPVQDIIIKRWSPYAFSDKPVSAEDLRSLFEAARWAASSYNDQPWFYIIGTKDDPEQYEKVLSCLAEGNQAWAKHVPVIGLGVIRTTFAFNGKPNRVALHDLGAASAQLTAEATSRGIQVHQMAGILPDKAREVFDIPEGYEIQTGIAIGYADNEGESDEELLKRDSSPRPRKKLEEFVFGGAWEQPHPIVKN